jgi:hypothetical protein
MRFSKLPASIVLVFSVLLLFPVRGVADKLKGFYSGSGGLSQEGHRVVFVEFGTDGTAIVQQKWHEKDPQEWRGRWVKDGSTVTVTYDPAKDPAKDGPTPVPLVMKFKHGSLTATSWDQQTLGLLGPPKLSPFGGENVQPGTVSSCQSINSGGPAGNCVTWSSKDRH